MPFSYHHKFTLQLAASTTLGIAATQSGTASTTLNLNGGLVTAGIANFDVPRRVIVTSAGNDTANTFTITGTDYFGRAQTEALVGASGTAAMTFRDFSTVSSIIPTSNTAGNVSSGTNGVGSTPPWIIDTFANPSVIGAGIVISGTANYNIEQAYNNLEPAWNVNLDLPTWYPSSGFANQSSNQNGSIQGPLTMLRLTINSGTGSVTARTVQAYVGRT